MKIRYLPLLLCFCLFSCESSDQVENRSAQPTEADSVLAPVQGPDDGTGKVVKPRYISRFAKAFFDFQEAVFNEDADGVNAFIEPEWGVFIIENPGALPKMTLVKDIRNFKRDFRGESFFTIKERLQTCELKEESLPAFTCGGENGTGGYSKEGCFAGEDPQFRESEIYKYASLPPGELKLAEKMMKQIRTTVVQTSSSYRLHFAYLKGRWRLLFIDLRIPCSA